jgi:hypothetical protein
MAGHNIELIKPDEVLSYLDAASRAARSAFSEGELSNQHAIAAWAHAQAGNMQEVHRETGLAEELFATADRSSVPDWQGRGSVREPEHPTREATAADSRANPSRSVT